MTPRGLANYYLRSHSYFKRRERCLGYPKIYTVELTNRCAMTCVMCPRKAMTRPIGDMNFETFRSVVDQTSLSANRVTRRDNIALVRLRGSQRRSRS